MSLFPHEDVLTKEIESWKGFAGSLSVEEDRKTFTKMLSDCYKYTKAINAKAQPFPSEPVIMALLFSQHKMIEWLERQISKGKTNVLNPLDQSLKEISHNYRLSDRQNIQCGFQFLLLERANIFQSRFSLIDSIVLSNASIFSFRCKILFRILS